MFSPPKPHMTKTTQESKSPDKHRHGCECNAAFTIAVPIYIILKLYILYGHVFIAPALEVRGDWKAKHRRNEQRVDFPVRVRVADKEQAVAMEIKNSGTV